MEIQDAKDLINFAFIISGVILLLVVSIILFITISQKRNAFQQAKIQRLRAQRQEDIFKSVVATQEKERARIAQNLHDEVGTSLSALSLILQRVSNNTEGELKEISIEGKDVALAVLQNIKSVINDLSPASLKKFGLAAEIEKLAMMVAKTDNLKVQLDIKDIERYSEEIEINLYRIFKEFFVNTMKYAQATTLSLHAKQIEELLHIELNDDGIGFDFKNPKNNGHGLKNIESRILLLNGTFSYISEPNKGTNLIIDIPLQNI